MEARRQWLWEAFGSGNYCACECRVVSDCSEVRRQQWWPVSLGVVVLHCWVADESPPWAYDRSPKICDNSKVRLVSCLNAGKRLPWRWGSDRTEKRQRWRGRFAPADLSSSRTPCRTKTNNCKVHQWDYDGNNQLNTQRLQIWSLLQGVAPNFY